VLFEQVASGVCQGSGNPARENRLVEVQVNSVTIVEYTNDNRRSIK